MTKLETNIQGMHCTSCALSIQNSLSKLKGIKDCNVGYASETLSVNYNPQIITEREITREIKRLGYSIGENKEENKNNLLRIKIVLLLPISIALFILMLSDIFKIHSLNIPTDILNPALFFISSISIFWIGIPYLKGILRFLGGKGADMDTLIGIGTFSAYIYSTYVFLAYYLNYHITLPDTLYFDSAIIVIGFITFGKYLESRSKKTAGEAISKLITLQSKTALVLRNGKEIKMLVEEILKDDIVILKPGNKVSVDGIIIEGFLTIDQSMLTGEYIPAEKLVGDKIYAGTLVLQGSAKFKAKDIGSKTVLSSIIQIVKQAQNSKAPIQKLADDISKIFVPIVLIIATLSLLTWTISGNLPLAISSFVAVLVISCPCALGLATPTAIIVGVGKGAQNGILIKNAQSLEKLHKINTVVFDKTGTLTEGRPVLDKIVTDLNKKDILKIAYSLEDNSEHPLAKAICDEAKKQKIKKEDVVNFKNIDGKGIQGTINKEPYYIGNLKFMKNLDIKTDSIFINNGTSVMLANKNSVIASFGIKDTLKSNAKKTISSLKKLNLETIMLTGDNRNSAKEIANELEIDRVFSDVLPTQKADIVKELQKEGRIVAMIGDGINDSPALALSDVSIAMSTGTQIAIETSDITLLSGNLEKIPQAILLSRKTVQTIRQNLFFAFIYNIIGIPLAAGILFPFTGNTINPAFAGFAMSLSSLSVVTNSLRLKFAKLQK